MLTKKQRLPLIIATVAVGIILLTAATLSQAGQTADELLAKKYQKILGRYQIESDGQQTILEFAVRQGALWADSGDGRPAEMKPVNDSLVEFTAQDAENGLFEFKFQKDETGDISTCRVICQALGLDMVAAKIKEIPGISSAFFKQKGLSTESRGRTGKKQECLRKVIEFRFTEKCSNPDTWCPSAVSFALIGRGQQGPINKYRWHISCKLQRMGWPAVRANGSSKSARFWP